VIGDYKFRPLSWESWQREWRDLDPSLLLFSAGLTALGGLAIRSTVLDTGLKEYWIQHLVTGAIGLLLALLLAKFPYERFLRFHWLSYGLMNISLIAVLIFGKTALGAQRWIAIGGFNLQPSEFAKVALIVSLAALIHNHPIRQPLDIPRVIWITFLPWFLIFRQPNLGTALVFAAITIAMLYWGGVKLRWLILLGSPLVSAILFSLSKPIWLGWLVAIAVIAWFAMPWGKIPCILTALVTNLVSSQLGQLLWNSLHDYQKLRITSFLDPNSDPLGTGYHLIQSRIAIGAGKLWGRGLQKGTQTQLNFIPEQHTDFIFSVVGEELGFIGCLLTLLLLFGICWRLLAIANQARDDFGSLLAIGVFAMVLFQACVNIGMTIGYAPITGIPLPWLSNGRSALLANFLALGLVESVALHRRTIKF
jgi:rod shape determining protein RodA